MIFVGILYCFVYTFGFSNVYILFCVYIWLFKSHIYMSGELIARYSFMQGFSALHGRFAMAQWLHRQLWGFRSTLWAYPELPSPSNMPTQDFQVLFLDGR